VTRPFWDALRAHRVDIQRCRECAAFCFYPRAACPRCWRRTLDWVTVPGTGHVHTFTVARAPTAPHFEDEVPQLIAIVELDEGPRLTTTLVGMRPEEVRVGLRVEPVFEDVPGRDITLLRYAAAQAHEVAVGPPSAGR
jgi:uncharacterized OB-fold protein